MNRTPKRIRMNREGPGKIGYLELDWSPVAGCTNGCSWCWARRQARRQKYNCRKCYEFEPHLHPERLDEPLKRRTPAVIGVAFMGDLFDPTLDDEVRDKVFAVMALAHWHTYVVLTKQPTRMLEYLQSRVPMDDSLRVDRMPQWYQQATAWLDEGSPGFCGKAWDRCHDGMPNPSRPLPHIYLGVSIEDQPTADERVPGLMRVAAMGWRTLVSIEPMRGPVLLSPRGWLEGRDDIGNCPVCAMPNRCRCTPQFPSLDGVILGGQTGPGAPPMQPDWVRAVRDDCQAAGVPFFFKSWGEWGPIAPDAPYETQVLPDGTPMFHTRGRFSDQRKRVGRILDGQTYDKLPWTLLDKQKIHPFSESAK